jgi:hypothetical protein
MRVRTINILWQLGLIIVLWQVPDGKSPSYLEPSVCLAQEPVAAVEDTQAESRKASLGLAGTTPPGGTAGADGTLESENQELVHQERELLQKLGMEVHAGDVLSAQVPQEEEEEKVEMATDFALEDDVLQKAEEVPEEEIASAADQDEDLIEVPSTIYRTHTEAPPEEIEVETDSVAYHADIESGQRVEEGEAQPENDQAVKALMSELKDLEQGMLEEEEFKDMLKEPQDAEEYPQMGEQDLILTLQEQKEFFRTRLEHLDRQIAELEGRGVRSADHKDLLTGLQRFELRLKSLSRDIDKLAAESRNLKKQITGSDDQTELDDYRPVHRKRTFIPIPPAGSEYEISDEEFFGRRENPEENLQTSQKSDLPFAVVMADEALIQAAPGQSGIWIFRISQGTELMVEHIRGNWLRVVTPTGVRGWVTADALGWNEI